MKSLHLYIDRIIQSPITVQFLLLAGLIMLILLIGAMIAGFTLDFKEAETGPFWWTFTRITDPGYLGDDQGAWERILSTTITIAGWVAFGGMLISIMTTAMEQRLERIKAGRVEIQSSNHTVILGWNTTIFSIVNQLQGAAHGQAGQDIVILAGREVNTMREEVEKRCPGCQLKRILFRQGSSESLQELQDLKFDRARQVIILGEQRQDTARIDTAMKIFELTKQTRPLEREALKCHIYLADLALFSSFKLLSIFSNARGQSEPVFFNFYENWARRTLAEYPLDRQRITADDPRYVHLVIVGFGQMGEAIAIQAAKTAHFANGRKTRLTIIDRQAAEKGRRFYARYPGIYDVVEIIFNNHDVEDPHIRMQCSEWAQDQNALLTVAVCTDDSTATLSHALNLPKEIRRYGVPVLVRLAEETGLMQLLRQSPGMEHLAPFGMINHGWDPTDQLDMLAKAIHGYYLEHRGHSFDQTDSEIRPPDEKPSDKPWNQLDQALKESTREAADHVDVKLRAVGCDRVLQAEAPGAEAFAFTAAEVEIMAKMEHARWSAEKRLAGWEYGSQRDDLNKVHDYLVVYEKLPESIKNYNRESVGKLPELLLKKLGMGIRRTA